MFTLASFRLRGSSVLVVGLRGLGSEVVKNIVLAGVNRVTILDHAPLCHDDVAGRFLMQQEGQNVTVDIYTVYISTTCACLELSVTFFLSLFLSDHVISIVEGGASRAPVTSP